MEQLDGNNHEPQLPLIEHGLSIVDLHDINQELIGQFSHGLLVGDLAVIANSTAVARSIIPETKAAGQILTDSSVPLGRKLRNAYFANEMTRQKSDKKLSQIIQFWTNSEGDVYPFAYIRLYEELRNLGPFGLYIADSAFLNKQIAPPFVLINFFKESINSLLRMTTLNSFPYLFANPSAKCLPLSKEQIAQLQRTPRWPTSAPL